MREARKPLFYRAFSLGPARGDRRGRGARFSLVPLCPSRRINFLPYDLLRGRVRRNRVHGRRESRRTS